MNDKPKWILIISLVILGAGSLLVFVVVPIVQNTNRNLKEIRNLDSNSVTSITISSKNGGNILITDKDAIVGFAKSAADVVPWSMGKLPRNVSISDWEVRIASPNSQTIFIDWQHWSSDKERMFGRFTNQSNGLNGGEFASIQLRGWFEKYVMNKTEQKQGTQLTD